MIGGISKVILDVEDQDRALAFWTQAMGFELAQDSAYGGERWIEVRSPDKAVVLVLGRTSAGPGDRASVPDMLPTSPFHFYCDDIEQTYRELAGRGVDFSVPPSRQSFGWWSLFNDTEGNRFALTTRDG